MLIKEHSYVNKVLISPENYQKIYHLSNILDLTYLVKDIADDDTPVKQFVDSASEFIKDLLSISYKDAKTLLYLIKFGKDEGIKITTQNEVYELLPQKDFLIYKIYK